MSLQERKKGVTVQPVCAFCSERENIEQKDRRTLSSDKTGRKTGKTGKKEKEPGSENSSGKEERCSERPGGNLSKAL